MTPKSGTPLITVFTATYNRASTLPRLYDSLRRQTCADFEWLVIDDGSADGTAALLKSYQASATFPIRYERVDNGGKQRAVNRGVRQARGKAFFIVDSDDALPPDALTQIALAWPEVDADAEACGLVGYKARFDGELLTRAFPEGVTSATSIEIKYRYGIQGDKAEVFKTEILKAYPFPEIEGEKFITEDVVYNRMARRYRLRLCPRTLYLAEYLAGGLSARSLELRVANPRGACLYYRELEAAPVPLAIKLRAALNIARISLLAGGRK